MPQSGGIYSFGRHYRGDFVGFLAGWFFLTGKTASAAAIALIVSTYLAPGYERFVAAGLIAVFTVVVISGIRTTATVSIIIATIVVVGLVAISTPALISAPEWPTGVGQPGWGVVTAAGLMFFAFAGYARMATLGEEVRDPVRTLPRAIIGALVVVLSLYALIGTALLPPTVWADGAGCSPGGPRDALPPAGRCCPRRPRRPGCSLLAILAGLSRTSLQMARHRDLPVGLSLILERTGGPVVSEVVVGVAAIALVLLTDPLWLVGLSGTGVLLYYAIGHYSALAQPRNERFLPAIVPGIGLVLCVLLVASLPASSLLAGLVWFAAGALWFAVASWRRRASDSA